MTNATYYASERFLSLPFNSTWQQVKDWVSASCDVDFVEVHPVSSSGWIRLKGKSNFRSAFTYMDNEPFKDRCIIIDGRNETECVNIRVRQPGRFNRRSSLTGGNRGRRTAFRPSQSPNQGPMPQHRRTHSLAQSEVDAADIAGPTRAPARTNGDVLALANFILGMSLRSTLQMQQQYGLPLGFPFYGGGLYTMGNANTFPFYDGGHEQDEAIFADDASQSFSLMMRAMMMAQSGVHHSSPPTFERRELEMKFAEDFVFESGKFSFL